jgi:hypothetical protein
MVVRVGPVRKASHDAFDSTSLPWRSWPRPRRARGRGGRRSTPPPGAQALRGGSPLPRGDPWITGRCSRSASTPPPMARERDQPTDPCEQRRHPRPRGDIDESKDDRGYEAQRRADEYEAPPPTLLRRLLSVGAHRPRSIPSLTRGSTDHLGAAARVLPDRSDGHPAPRPGRRDRRRRLGGLRQCGRTTSVANPVVSVFLGALVLQERLDKTPPWHAVVAIGALAFALLGAVIIASASEEESEAEAAPGQVSLA